MMLQSLILIICVGQLDVFASVFKKEPLPFEFEESFFPKSDEHIKTSASYLPLGMETNQIKDQQITASSVFCYNAAKHEAKNGRLNNQYAWCAAHDFRDNKNQFLRVSLGELKIIAAVATQGQPSFDNWVKSYKIRYSKDGANFKTYQEDGEDKIFTANWDRNTIKTQVLKSPFKATTVEINPQSMHGNDICLRIELYESAKPTCSLSLGMENNQIKDQQITASSVFCYNAAKHEAKNGRLKHQYAWCAAHDFRDNKNQFLRVNLGEMKIVGAVATQGQPSFDNWVKSYKIRYSKDGANFKTYQEHGEDKIFTGNSDRNTIKKHVLTSPVQATAIEINPQSFHGNDVCLRIELYECQG